MKTARKILLYLGLCLGWVIFGWQIYVAVKTIISAKIILAEPTALLVASLLMVVYFGIQIVNWYNILIGLGGKAAFLDVARGYFLSFVPRYIPGTVWGYFSRSEWMYSRYQIPYRSSGMASLIEVIVSITSALTVIGLLAFVLPFPGSRILLLFIGLPFLVLIILTRLEKIRPIVILKYRFTNPLQPIAPVLWIKSHLLFFLQWLVFGVIYWFLLIAFVGNSLNEIDPITGIVYSIFSFTLSWTIGFLVLFIPGGIGIRELALTAVTSSLFGIDNEVCSLVAVTLRILSSFVEIILIACGLNPFKHSKSKH